MANLYTKMEVLLTCLGLKSVHLAMFGNTRGGIFHRSDLVFSVALFDIAKREKGVEENISINPILVPNIINGFYFQQIYT